MNLKVGKVYKLTKRIGQGAFGEIFHCLNLQTSEEFAAKLESIKNPHPQLFFEAKLYQYLHTEPTEGIPHIYYTGTEGEYNIMVMDLLGLSLEDFFNKSNRKFSLKTVLLLIEQMITRIEYLHTRNFLHRDIKPDNFLMGIKEKNRLFLVDYGLAKKFIDKNGKHIPYKENKNLTGTARYASVNTHLGIEQARRDDLESIGYVVMYFLKGGLPWMNMKQVGRDEQYKKIMEKKIGTSVDSLCKGFPEEFAVYLKYCRELKFEEKPDYAYLKGLFRGLMGKCGFEYDGGFDWKIGKNCEENGDLRKKIEENGELKKKIEENGDLKKRIVKNGEENRDLKKKIEENVDLKKKIEKNNEEKGGLKKNINNNNAKKEEIPNKVEVLYKKTGLLEKNKFEEAKMKENVKVFPNIKEKNQEKAVLLQKNLKKNSMREIPNKGTALANLEKEMMKTQQSSQNYNGPRIVVNKATYK